MEIVNHTSVNAPLETLWDVLEDVERVSPYIPGFELQEVDGDVYRGTVKVKLGAVTVAYNAEIEVLRRDADTRTVTMEISGRERRGPGSVHATVLSQLAPQNGATAISMTTDLRLTGRVAQLGGGVIQDVSQRLLRQFAAALEEGVAPRPAVEAHADGAEQPAGSPRAAVAPVDLTAAAGGAALRRLGPFAALLLAAAVVSYRLGRRR